MAIFASCQMGNVSAGAQDLLQMNACLKSKGHNQELNSNSITELDFVNGVWEFKSLLRSMWTSEMNRGLDLEFKATTLIKSSLGCDTHVNF